VISSAEVVDRVRRVAPALPASRFRAIVPPPGHAELTRVAGVPVRVIRARHNPTRRLPEQHVAFLVGDRTVVLHVGDADPVADNFASLPAVDVAILPFWYLTSAASRAMVATAIRPRRMLAVHVPPVDAAEIAATLREAGVAASLPTSVGRVFGPP
jgi:hypothetical protein